MKIRVYIKAATAAIATATTKNQINLTDLRPGQTWECKKKGLKILILKKVNNNYTIKDKFGDLFKRTPSELLAELQQQGFTLTSTADVDRALEQIGLILLPFFVGKPFVLEMVKSGVKRAMGR